MKTKILLIACLFLSACAADSDTDNGAGDDGSDTGPDAGTDTGADATPTPTGCQTAADCDDDVACTTGVCQTDGTCRYDATCTADQVCDEDADACETPVAPVGHGISCFQAADTLYVTINGKLTDAVYGGTLAHPVYVAVASDQIAGSWNPSSSSSGPSNDLSAVETAGGYASSLSIHVPSDQAQRFTLLTWSDDNGGYWRRLDLSKWDVSGDGCAKIADGAGANGTSDGYVIGRAPLCASACDDSDSSTPDTCQADGCHHGTGGGGTTTPVRGSISCSESGSNTNVTISGGILDHLFSTVTPDSTWLVRFGYGGTAQMAWTSNLSSYTLTMPNTVHGFNFTLKDPVSGDHWFDLDEFDISGSCTKGNHEVSH